MSRHSQRRSSSASTITGVLRVDASTAQVVRRIRRGDIAILDQLDLDSATAQALIDRGAGAVLNVQVSVSGRYPVSGATLLLDAGIPLVDQVDPQVLAIRDGLLGTVTLPGHSGLDTSAWRAEDQEPESDLSGGKKQETQTGAEVTVTAGPHSVTGRLVTQDDVSQALAAGEENLGTQLSVFTANLMDSLTRSAPALLEGQGLPSLGVDVSGKHVLVVAPGAEHVAQLRRLKPFIKDHKPIVIAIGEAAESALTARLKPAVVVGDVESTNERTLAAIARVIVHDPEGMVAASRVDSLTSSHETSSLDISSEDLAILLAHFGGAASIVTVGIGGSFREYLESGSADTGSSFLTRLVAGNRIVDGSLIAKQYRPRWTGVVVTAAVVLALAALGAALWANAESRTWIESLVGIGAAGS